MNEQAHTAAETPYFYFLRIQWQHPAGALVTKAIHGVAPVRPGMSRHKLFTMLREDLITRSGAPATADVTAFELTPDTI